MKTPKLDLSKLTPDQRDKLEQYQQTQAQIDGLQEISGNVKKLIDTVQSTDSTSNTEALGATLKDIHDQLTALNSKEAPEAPDYAQPVVEAVGKLDKSLRAINISPEVNVAAPNVQVDAPVIDLTQFNKILKTDIPKAFDKAIKSIPRVEIPETDNTELLDAWAGIAEQLVSIENATRMKPLPGTMKVTNLDGTAIGSTNKVLHYGVISQATAGTDIIVPATTANQRIKVISYVFTIASTGTVKFTSSGNLTGVMDMSATGGAVAISQPSSPLFASDYDTALSIVTTGGAAHGHFTYLIEP